MPGRARRTSGLRTWIPGRRCSSPSRARRPSTPFGPRLGGFSSWRSPADTKTSGRSMPPTSPSSPPACAAKPTAAREMESAHMMGDKTAAGRQSRAGRHVVRRRGQFPRGDRRDALITRKPGGERARGSVRVCRNQKIRDFRRVLAYYNPAGLSLPERLRTPWVRGDRVGAIMALAVLTANLVGCNAGLGSASRPRRCPRRRPRL